MKEMHRLDAGKGAAPTDVLWTDEKLWVVSADGRMSVWNKDVLPSPVQTDSKPMTVAIDAENEETAEKTVTTAAPVRKRLQKARSPVDKEEDDDDDDDVDFSQPANPFIQDQAEEDNDDDSLEATLQNTTPSVRAMQEDRLGSGADDDDDDDENSFDMDQMPPPSSRVGANWGPPPPAVEAQAAFGPSSTPLEDPRRFFCWNQVGALSVRQTDPGRATVDIDFTDSAFRRPISFTDTIGFILGSLGEDGAILASDIPEDEDDEDNAIGDVVDGLNISETTKQALKKSRKQDSPTNGSTIYFHRYETFDSNRNKDWYLTLPAGERALGCATGEGWAAVVTHRRFVRLFTTGGNQGQIFWIEGDPVTMVGRSRFLAVFYHQSAPLSDGTQKMGYTLFDAVEGRIVAKGALSALSTRASLQWVGFSSESSLMAMDSDGMLSMLVSSADASTHWEWTPVLDTMALRKSTKDTHWPIHVSSGKLICIPLKGGVKYPDVARRPVTSSLGLRLPLARGSLMQVQALEELSIRASVALHQRKVVEQALNPGQEEEEEEFAKEYHALSAQVDKVTLKLFASIVEAGKLERALDLVERLHLERSFDLAMTIADRHRKLVDRIENVKELKFPVDEEDNAGEESYLSATDSPLETNSRDFSSITPDAEAGRSKRAFWAEEGSRKVRRTADA
jgi:chromosome transmission fidelity protein 4